jgi:hypothetical protein
MTPIADMVAKMLAAGTPHEAIVLAVETAEKVASFRGNSAERSAENPYEKRLAADRERKRLSKLSAEIPQNSAVSAEIPHAAISIKEQDSKKEKKNSRGSKISAEWKPNASHYTEGYQLGFDRAKVDSFAHDMRLWAEANAHRREARKLDWDKTFSGWMRRQKPGSAPPSLPLSAKPKSRDPPELPAEQHHFYRWFRSDMPEGLPPEKWQAFTEEKLNGKAHN